MKLNKFAVVLAISAAALAEGALAEIISFTTVSGGSGQLTFDPASAVLQYSFSSGGGAIYGGYSFAAPTSFTLTEQNGFSLTQSLTAFNVQTERSGGGDYYVFDADVGAYGSTPWSRLELAFSNNSPNVGPINNLSVPSSINLANFQFKTALYATATAQGEDTVNYRDALSSVNVAAVPEPETYAMLLVGLGLIGAVARRRRAEHTGPVAAATQRLNRGRYDYSGTCFWSSFKFEAYAAQSRKAAMIY